MNELKIFKVLVGVVLVLWLVCLIGGWSFSGVWTVVDAVVSMGETLWIIAGVVVFLLEKYRKV